MLRDLIKTTKVSHKRKSFFMHIIILIVSHVNMLLFSQFIQPWLGTVGHMPCIHPGNNEMLAHTVLTIFSSNHWVTNDKCCAGSQLLSNQWGALGEWYNRNDNKGWLSSSFVKVQSDNWHSNTYTTALSSLPLASLWWLEVFSIFFYQLSIMWVEEGHRSQAQVTISVKLKTEGHSCKIKM